MSMFEKYRNTFILLVVFVTAFVFASHFARLYEPVIRNIVHGTGVYGPVIFIILTALFVVFVIPLDIVFLIPVGVSVWGAVPVALMSITGWVIGAGIAFYIARHFGSNTVKKLIGLKRVNTLEKRIPKRNIFWLVVLWRMAVSVDVLSYALGLVSSMPFWDYVLATAIGVAPFGFFFAYAGTLPIGYQAIFLTVAIAILSTVLYRYRLPPREP